MVQILRNLLPAMRPGARVIIFDIILPPDRDETTGRPSVPRSIRKMLGAVDMQMHMPLNAKERKVDEWVAVTKKADPRFRLSTVRVVPGAPLGILEFILQE